MYYLRTKSAVNAIQFTLSKEKKTEEAPEAPMSPEEFKAMVAASRNAEPDDCEMCGS